MCSKIRRWAVIASLGGALSGLAAGSAQAAIPTATTLPATAVTTRTAILNGSVDTNGSAALWEFQYGKTPIYYSQSTPAQVIPAGHGTVPVSWKVKGLKPGTSYSFHLIAREGVGSSYYPLNTDFGAILTFATKKLGRLIVTKTKLSVHNGRASIPVRCASTQTCKGKLSLTARITSHQKLTLARKSFTVRAGGKAKLHPLLTRSALLVLGAAPNQRLGVRVNARLYTGQPKFSKKVTLILK